MGCPCDKILQVAEYWGVAGCSPGQSSLAAVPAGFYHIDAFVIYLLGLTPCALNGLPYHGIQVQSQSQIWVENIAEINGQWSIDAKLGFDNPSVWPPSHASVSDRWIPNKNSLNPAMCK